MNVFEYARAVARQYDDKKWPFDGRFIYLTEEQIGEALDRARRAVAGRDVPVTSVTALYGLEVRSYGT